MSKLSEYSKFDHLILDDDDDDEDDNDNVVAVTDQSSTSRSQSTSTQMSSSDKDMIRHVRKHPISINNNNNTSTNTNLRFMVQYNGNTVYEWEQSLNEVIIYIISPIQNHNKNNTNNNNAKIFCHISATHLQVGIQQQQQQQQQQQPSDMKHYYIDEDIYHPIDTRESTWCIEQEDVTEMNSNQQQQQQQQQDVITIYLQKVAKGMVWEAPLRGHFHTTDGNDNHHNKLDPISLQDVQRALLLERWQEENPGMDFRDATFNGGSIPDPRTYMGGIGYE